MSNLLQHKTFISTRPAGQNEELKILLESHGAQLLEMPTIEILPANLSSEDEESLNHINQFSWIVFTSPNGIRFFFDKLNEVTGSYYLPPSIKLATVGKKTSDILLGYGHETTLHNPGNTGEDLANELMKAINSEDAVLFPEGDLARGVITKMISAVATCENMVVYQNSLPVNVNSDALQRIIKNQYEGIILTSPSGFNNLLALLKNNTNRQKLKLICIGSTTASEVLANGLTPMATARVSSAEGIVEAILNVYQSTIIK